MTPPDPDEQQQMTLPEIAILNSNKTTGLYGGSATGDCPAAGTPAAVTVQHKSPVGCEFVASSIARFLQNLVDNVGLSR